MQEEMSREKKGDERGERKGKVISEGVWGGEGVGGGGGRGDGEMRRGFDVFSFFHFRP